MHYSKTAATATPGAVPLRDHVSKTLRNFLENIGAHTPSNFYDTVLTEIEHPLLEEVMRYTRQNQSKAAKMLGINRGTFRKKLAFYGML
jgi:Fis family transcriptional regulator